MASKRRIVAVGALVFITCAHAYPQDSTLLRNRQPRQDDDDDGTTRNPYDFGANVAQIIAGAFTGNLDSIIKGSFGFIGDPTVNKLSHNTWETLKGNPTTTTTEKNDDEDATEPPAPPPPPPPRPQQQTRPAVPAVALPPVREAPRPVVDVASLSPGSPPRVPAASPSVPIQVAPAAAPALPVGETPAAPALEVVKTQSRPTPPPFVYAPDVYYPGSPLYPTKIPAVAVRTKRPTYATLAPLSVVEGTATTEPEPVEASTQSVRTTTEEDDDGDEAEGLLSEEFGGSFVGRTTALNNVAENAGKETAVGGTNLQTTTEDDEQEQIDYNYRVKD